MAVWRRDPQGPSFLSSPDLVRWLPQVLLGLGVSGLLNVVQLMGSYFAHQIFDRVLPAHDFRLLAGLTALALGGHAGYVVLDHYRCRSMARTGRAIARDLDRRVFGSLDAGLGLEPLGHSDRLGRFLIGGALPALFDVMWLPVYFAAICALHPALGLLAATGTVLLAAVSVGAEPLTRKPLDRLARRGRERVILAAALIKNAHEPAGCAERVGRVANLWSEHSAFYFHHQAEVSELGLQIAAVAKWLRLALQSGGLAVGASLVIAGGLSLGGFIASSVLLSRTFACLDAALCHWRGLIAAHDSYVKLVELFSSERAERCGITRETAGAKS